MEEERITKVRKGRNVIFTVFACLMTGFIVFLSSNIGQKIYNSYNPNHSSSIKKTECVASVNENDLIKLYDIIGVDYIEESYLGLNMFLSGINKELSNLTLDEKKLIIYWYASENKLVETREDSFEQISIENFDRIKEYYGITEDYTMFFESNMINNGYVLYPSSGVGGTTTIKHNFSSKVENDKVILTDNALLNEVGESTPIEKDIEYTFSKNSKGEYYLASSIIIK